MHTAGHFLPDTAATEALGAAFFRLLADGRQPGGGIFSGSLKENPAQVVGLYGDLGSGKTTFVRGFLRAAGFGGAVKSPTYNLLEIYRLPAGKILHFDLYRFAEAQEWEDAGFDDELSGSRLVFIEWPQNGAGYAPAEDWRLCFTVQETARMCTIGTYSQTAQELFDLWRK